MAIGGKLSEKAITSHLRRLAAEMVNVDGTAKTREQALAELVWKFALGWEEETRDDDANPIKKFHPPVAWAMQYLFERIEGKAPVASAEQTTGVRALDKVRSLAKERLNSLATKSAPPTFRAKSVSAPGFGDPADSGSDVERGGAHGADGA